MSRLVDFCIFICQTFSGNVDSNSIKVNRMIIPAKAMSVMLMPLMWQGNVAFRMELYGCPSSKQKLITFKVLL